MASLSVGPQQQQSSGGQTLKPNSFGTGNGNANLFNLISFIYSSTTTKRELLVITERICTFKRPNHLPT